MISFSKNKKNKSNGAKGFDAIMFIFTVPSAQFHNPGSSLGKNIIFFTNVTRFPPSVDILGNQRRVHLTPCLCGMGCKRTLVLEMENMIYVYLIISIIIRLYIAANELQRDVKQYSIYSAQFQMALLIYALL